MKIVPAAVLGLVLVLGACATQPTLAERAQRIKVGMSVAEVEAVMGPPQGGYSLGSGKRSFWVRGGEYGPVAETAYGEYEGGILAEPLQMWPHPR